MPEIKQRRYTPARSSGVQASALAGLSAEYLRELHHLQTDLLRAVRGLVVNDVLRAETAVLDAAGVWSADTAIPFASVAVSNFGTGILSVTAAPAESTAPTVGAGLLLVGAGRGATMNLAGGQLSLYGTPGALVSVQLFARPQPPAGWTVADEALQSGGIWSRQVTATTSAGVLTLPSLAPVEVLNADGAGRVYLTTTGTAPSIGGNDSHVLPAAIGSVSIRPQTTALGYIATAPTVLVVTRP